MIRAGFLAGLLSVANASPFGAAESIFRRASCNRDANAAFNCLNNAGPGPRFVSAYCSSSYLSTVTKTSTSKLTTTLTSYTTTVTETLPVSTISTATSAATTVQATITATTIFTTTSTITSTTATITSTSSITSTVYTCPFPANQNQKRADTTTFPADATTSAQQCVTTHGWIQLSSACNGCITPALSTPTSTSTVTSVSTKTTKTKSTTTVTPTAITVYTTTIATPTITNTNSETLSTASITTLFVEATTTTTVTSTVTLASPTSNAFSIVYKNAAGDVLTARKVQSPGSAGTLIAFGTGSGDLFASDPSFNLFDGSIVEKNAQDPYPYLFLDYDGSPVGELNPRFTTCDGQFLGYDSPRTPSTFALCNGFLALGGNFGPAADGTSPCTPITLGYSFPGQIT